MGSWPHFLFQTKIRPILANRYVFVINELIDCHTYGLLVEGIKAGLKYQYKSQADASVCLHNLIAPILEAKLVFRINTLLSNH